MDAFATTDVVINGEVGGFSISKECIARIHELFIENGEDIPFDYVRSKFIFTDDVRKRSHPYLVKAVRELGKSANGMHSKLVIESIPTIAIDSAEITEYDGAETLRWNVSVPLIKILNTVSDVDSLEISDARFLIQKLKDIARQQECTP